MTDLENTFRDYYAAAKADPANAGKPDVVLRRESREKALSAVGRVPGEARAGAAEAKTEGDRMALMQRDIRFLTAVSKLGTKDPKVLQDVNNTLMELRREYGVGVQAAPTAPAAPAQAAPAQGAAALPAMPKKESDAIDGQVYNTPRGPARWDATQKKFFPVTQGQR
jgi:hypothetical protein